MRPVLLSLAYQLQLHSYPLKNIPSLVVGGNFERKITSYYIFASIAAIFIFPSHSEPHMLTQTQWKQEINVGS